MAAITYRQMSLAATVVFFVLFATLLAIPELIFWLFQIDESASAEFMSRRAAFLFLGMATICFLSREVPQSEVRNAICLGICVAMLGLAVLGLIELMSGNVGLGILLAVCTELVFALGFFQLSRSKT